MREAGIALLIASVILGLFLFLPRGEGAVVSQEPIAKMPDVFADVSVAASAAIVYDLATGDVLYARNADAQLPLASLTKLLTAYAAFSTLSPDTPVMIPNEALALEYPRAFNAGQSFRLSDLARLTLTASLNDGAVAMASATAKQLARSPDQALASVASALGLSQTFAVNGSGLDMSTVLSGGYGSAYDLARLAGALVKLVPDVAYATTQRIAEAVSLGGTAYSVKNTDPVVDEIPGLLLSKTGFTELAGGNLALVIDVGLEHPVAIIVLGSTKEGRFADALKLVRATYSHFAKLASL